MIQGAASATNAPMSTMMIWAPMATVSDTRAPHISLVNSSRPSASVPSQCARDGG